MNRRLLELYWRLPGSLRNLGAGLHGRRLASRRYGPETDELAAAYLAAEREPCDDGERLAEALWRASRTVPYYRALWARRRGRGFGGSVERLENWPLLEKEEVRLHPKAFVADDAWTQPLWVERTSGTTGTPLKLYRSRRTLRARYALYEARHRYWYGLTRRDRWAMAGGQLVAPRDAVAPPYWVWNAPLRQLYVSSYHLAREQAEQTLDEIARRECRYLWGYPSSLAALAQAALEGGSRLPLDTVVANAEALSEQQRRLIESAFAAPCRETYGMVELAAGGGECEAGRLHLFPELGHVELLRDGAPALEGEIVATSLLDADMPLIRYRTRDWGGPIEAGGCECGRTLPLIGAIQGRCDDLLWSVDGRPVGRLDPVFKDELPVRQTQIGQDEAGRVRVLVVPASGFDQRAARRIVQALRDRLGDWEMEVETVTSIPRGPNGKMQATISRYRPVTAPQEAPCLSR